MRSLTERQWQLYFGLADRLQQLPHGERRAALPALCGRRRTATSPRCWSCIWD